MTRPTDPVPRPSEAEPHAPTDRSPAVDSRPAEPLHAPSAIAYEETEPAIGRAVAVEDIPVAVALGIPDVARDATAARFRDWLAWVLRGGVFLAAAFCLLGLLLGLTRGPQPMTLGSAGLALDMGARLAAGDPTALVGLGIVTLALVPVARVVFSLVHFIQERDRLYALLTTCVLGLLAIGVAMGRV